VVFPLSRAFDTRSVNDVLDVASWINVSI